MDGLNGAGVSVPDTRECVSDPFHRDPVLYFVAGSGFSLHSKGFNRAPYGDSSSTADGDAGSAGSGSPSPIIADDFGSVSLGFTQPYLFRSELGGLAQHGYLKLEPSDLLKRGLLCSSGAEAEVARKVSDPSVQLSLGPHGGGKATAGASDSGWLNRSLTGGFLAQTNRIGDWFSGTDLVGSDLRTHGENLGPQGDGKVLPTTAKMKHLQLAGVSESAFEPGSHDPVDEGKGILYGRVKASAEAKKSVRTADVQLISAKGFSSFIHGGSLAVGPTMLRLILPRHKSDFSGWVTMNFQHACPCFASNWALTSCQLTSLQGRNALDCKCLYNAFTGTFLLDSALHWGCVSFPKGMLWVLLSRWW